MEAPPDADVLVFGPDMDAEGGIAFDPDNAADLLSDIENALSAGVGSNLYVVTGTGGGVGVTTLTVHLAMNAAREHSTCCIGGHGMGLRLDLPADAPVWDEGAEIDGVTVPVAGGFRVALTENEGTSAIDPARARFDRVLVDVSGRDDDVFRSARAVVLVMPPTVPGARAALEVTQAHPDVGWALVTNRLGPGGEMTRVALEQIVGRRIAVELPTCAPLRDAEDDGRLLDSVLYRWPRRVAQLWNALERS
jgi:hypothetical protein